MKKLLLLVLTLILSTALAACGGDKANNEKADGKGNEEQVKGEDQGADEGQASEEEWPEELINPEAANNEYFIKVHDLLKENGYEVGELTPSDYSFFNAKMAAQIEINGEDMFTLQMYDLDPADENLEHARKTGMGTAEYAGEKGEIPVLVIDHYYFFLAEGHPNYEDVYKLLEEKLK
ncbi:hypothetical protein KHA93_15185 [Bacillus sp. FJAT-49732]|uniref:Lipoprotein n=1 Tax=Lederbergia citrisecunda TaxID=2833583 RepID=A0A942TNT3_9BACI|nr:hypothetical protein [Lederbergia citrisecunda]MBS4200980.1 hypothetical protein [Lederbergia citrisecunda]